MSKFFKGFCEFLTNQSDHENYFEGAEGAIRMVFFMFVVAMLGSIYLLLLALPPEVPIIDVC